MRIATFNINGLNKRLANLLEWLASTKPDVVCLQEIKCAQRDFPLGALETAGYGAIWQGQGAHHGVAILQRGAKPVEVRRGLPGFEDEEARYIEAAVEGVLVGCLYLPNGNPWPGPRFVYKQRWFEALNAYAATLIRDDIPSVLAGDYNVVPTDADIYNMRSWHTNALVQPEPRASYAALVAQGWTDALADLHPHGETLYTFWHYLRESWERNAGLRIDHLLVSPALIERLWSSGVDAQERAVPNASDHAPAWVELPDLPQ